MLVHLTRAACPSRPGCRWRRSVPGVRRLPARSRARTPAVDGDHVVLPGDGPAALVGRGQVRAASSSWGGRDHAEAGAGRGGAYPLATMWSSRARNGAQKSSTSYSATGLACRPELRPGHDLDQLVEGAGAAGQGDERVGQVGHPGLALVHGADQLEPGQAGVSDLALDEVLRQYADHLAARCQRRVGQQAHQADVRAAVHDAVPGLRDRPHREPTVARWCSGGPSARSPGRPRCACGPSCARLGSRP